MAVSVFFVSVAFLFFVRVGAGTTSAEQEVRELEQRANAAYEANDLPKYFSFYSPDFTQYLPEGRSDLPSYEKEWSSYIGEGNRVEKVVLSDMHVQIGPSGDTAGASYIIHVRTELKDGKVPDEYNQQHDVRFIRN